MQRKKHHHHLKFYGAPEETQQPCPEIDSLKPNSKRPKLGLLPQKETRKYSNCIHFQVRTCCSCFREGKGQLSNHPWVLDLLYSLAFRKKTVEDELPSSPWGPHFPKKRQGTASLSFNLNDLPRFFLDGQKKYLEISIEMMVKFSWTSQGLIVLFVDSWFACFLIGLSYLRGSKPHPN